MGKPPIYASSAGFDPRNGIANQMKKGKRHFLSIPYGLVSKLFSDKYASPLFPFDNVFSGEPEQVVYSFWAFRIKSTAILLKQREISV
jgi:hypothetical protein